MIAIRKSLAELTPADEARLLRRGDDRPRTWGDEGAAPGVAEAVAAIVAEVRERGDDALRELARRFDGATLDALEVPRSEWDAAAASLDDDVLAALRFAADRIRRFHRAQLPPPLEVEISPGVRLGRRAEPLRRVGVYAPGGRAAYPSSVLMGVVPARVAGVDEVMVCSPPGPDGRPAAAVLAACAIAGADRVFALGGAGAVAALAYGTGAVPRVDKIVGPGNAYVTEAKRRLTDRVAIDTPAGPSELLVVADETADPERIALELVAQAEHDPDAAVALVATSEPVVRRVRAALEVRVPREPRREIVEASLAANGALLSADDLDAALAFAERYAPEHLLLLVRDPRAALDRARAAGTIFLGESSSVAFGDYLTGANHVLPTGGLARAYSGLSTLDFLRWTTYQEVLPEAAAALVGPTAALAEAEGLPAHAAAAARAGGRDDAAAANDPGRRLGSGAPHGGAGGHAERVARASATAADATAAPIPTRAAYRELAPYDPGRRPVDVDLSDNTNRFGAHPAALRALEDASADTITRYPSVYAEPLASAIARRLGVPVESVVTGCGSDDVIDAAVRAFCEPGDVVAFPSPTFGMIPVFSRMNAARPVRVPLGPDLALDSDTLAAARPRIAYLCRPNNPTGTLFDAAAIERLAERSSGVVLVDEAYAEFAGESLATAAAGSERLVVMRTFSKAYGLAGLRVGWAVGPARVIAEIRKARGPYKVAGPAEAAAAAAIAAGTNWLDDIVARTRENRDRLVRALAERGLDGPASAANFVLVRCPADRPAPELADALRRRGVGVRAFADLPVIGDAIRVTVGPWPLMARFLDALDDALADRDRDDRPPARTAAASPGTAPDGRRTGIHDGSGER